jgi:putative heme-binding domain-containing protein
VRGQGGSLGPDLDDIGARRSAAHIREALTDPEASVPTGFLQVRLLTKDEREITAVRINEDAFSIQVRDLRNRFHSFWKDELRALERDWGRSPMVSYGTMLTSEQIDDLVAYLVSLQGRP